MGIHSGKTVRVKPDNRHAEMIEDQTDSKNGAAAGFLLGKTEDIPECDEYNIKVDGIGTPLVFGESEFEEY